jgi:tellurite resistance protein
MGNRDPATTTPVLYLPTVAGSFVSTIVLGAFGHPDWASPCYSTAAPAPTLGIQLAPPTVGCSAYLSITSGPPDLLAQALIGYGVFQALLMIRLIPWIARQPFAPSYWAFTFGLAALAISVIRFAERGAPGPISSAAPYVFTAVNLAIGGIAAGTVWLLLRGRLLPPPLQPPPESLHPAPRVI